MHGKQFLLDAAYAGIDENNVYGRLDFKGKVPQMQFEIVVNLEFWAEGRSHPTHAVRLEAIVESALIRSWQVTGDSRELASSQRPDEGAAKVALVRDFEFRLPLAWLGAQPVAAADPRNSSSPRLHLRFSLWHNRLPVDALPPEGWIELQLLEEGDLMALA